MKTQKKNPRFKNQMAPSRTIGEYADNYIESVRRSISQVSAKELEKAFEALKKALKKKSRVYVGGNGGSAAISDHLCCDWMKGTQIPGKTPLRVHSLMGSTALLTALANDNSYEESLSAQIEMLGEAGDVLVLISSSGNSPNIVAAVKAAKEKKMTVIGLSGFSGGKLRDLADISLYVPFNNYGVVEDSHQMLMHILTQSLSKMLDGEKAGNR